jgi:hypothetical protein
MQISAVDLWLQMENNPGSQNYGSREWSFIEALSAHILPHGVFIS